MGELIKGYKKRILQSITVILLCCVIISVFGCYAADSDVTEEEISSKQELLIWSYYETDAQTKGLDELTRSFNEAQDQYEITWEHVPMTEFDRRISRAYTEQELPDIVIIDNPDMQRFIQLGMFEDITEYAKKLKLDEDYFMASVGTTKYEDSYYGVPFNSNNVCLIYRPDMLKAAGVDVPENWDDFSDAVHKLSGSGTYGFLMSSIDAEQGAFQICSWVIEATEEGKDINGEAVKEALSLLTGLVEDGCMPADCINYSQTDVARRFIDGDIAIMENGPWVFSMLDEAGIDYELAPMPSYKRSAVVLGGENLGIIKGKNVEGAVEFIKYCAEKGGTERFCDSTDLLPSKVSYAEELVKKKPELKIIMDQMEYAISRTDIKEWKTLSNTLTEGFSKVITGEMSLDEVSLKIK